MVFNVLWTILLGILGGVISSLIVSRVFFIQGEYQEQMKIVDHVIRKLGSVSAYLQVFKSIYETDYDEELKMESEMREKKYNTEEEYYAAHKEKRWISKDFLLEKIKSEMDKTTNAITTEISGTSITNSKLTQLFHEIIEFVHDIKTTKEFSFSSIRELQRTVQTLQDNYDDIVRVTGRTILKLVLSDKFMIIMYIILIILIVATAFTGLFGV